MQSVPNTLLPIGLRTIGWLSFTEPIESNDNQIGTYAQPACQMHLIPNWLETKLHQPTESSEKQTFWNVHMHTIWCIYCQFDSRPGFAEPIPSNDNTHAHTHRIPNASMSNCAQDPASKRPMIPMTNRHAHMHNMQNACTANCGSRLSYTKPSESKGNQMCTQCQTSHAWTCKHNIDQVSQNVQKDTQS